jgi:predicted nucleic acid-binding protein
MMRVVDASVVAQLLLEPADVALRERFFADRNAAPHVLDPEVVHVIRRHKLGGRISPEHGRVAVDYLARLPILRHDHRWLLRRAWQLHVGVSAYDAVYVALAEALEVALWTRDQRLAAAARDFVALEAA